jgi:cell wall-associated NlpC family hydrolase
MTIGNFTISVNAAPTAGITSYTTDIASSSVSPTAGISLAISQCAASVEDASIVASSQPDTTANESNKVTSEYDDIAVATVDNFVYVRKKPSADSKKVGKLYKNNVGTVLKQDGDWYKIKSGNITGYVSADYVSVGDEELAKKAGRRVATVDTETLKVRKKASADAEVLGLVPEGDDLTVISEKKEGWVKVSAEEGDGYVSSEYVTLSTEYTYGETVAEEEARLKKEEAEAAAAAAAAAQSAGGSSSSNSSSSSSGSSSSSSGSSSSSSGSSTGSAVASYACQFVGNPYVYGGTSLTNGADCSGFVMSVYAHFGVSLPHSSSALRGVGRAVSTSDMQPGDIICYSGHCAIYIGNNTIVHASNPSSGIKISSPANYRTILAVRRIF